MSRAVRYMEHNRLQSQQVVVKKVCVIGGRGVYSRRTGVHGEKGSGINLTNDEEEGFTATRSVWAKGVSALNFGFLYKHCYLLLSYSELLLAGY